MIKFERHPDIAFNAAEFNKGGFKTIYTHDYSALFKGIATGALNEREVLRSLFANDLWFLVCHGLEVKKANHPFVVNMARMLETGPKTMTLDVWARMHFKAERLDEPTPTPRGWKNHGDLRIGDDIFSIDGLPCKVIGLGNIVTDGLSYELEFCDGTRIESSADHEWVVERRTRKRIPMAYKTAGPKRLYREKVIMTTRDIVEYGFDVDNRLSIPVAGPLVLPEKDLSIPPYILGAWLGDGTSLTGDISCGDDEVFHIIEKNGMQVGRNKTPLRTSALRRIIGLRKLLTDIGVKGLKHIPLIYLRSSKEQRLELLRGLMDTDGTCDDRGTATFANTNERLIEGVVELLNTLGMKPHKRKVESTFNGVPYTFWQVSFQAYKGFSPFHIQRKSVKCKDGIRKNVRRYIVSAKQVPFSPMRCIMTDREDGIYLTGKSMVPTHNSLLITQGETIQYHLKNPEDCSAIFAYVRSAAKTFLRSIKLFYETSDLLKWCFPEVLWKNPSSESPKWSEDEGLIFKRKNSARKESTIEAWGLIEGMPTGRHFERRIYDDIETDDIRDSPDMLQKCFEKFEMSANLGTDNGIERVIGTFYSHYGPMVKIRNKKDINGNFMYCTRVQPATEDGTINGRPVLLSQAHLDRLKAGQFFNSQQLCDPTPTSEIKLNFSMLKPIEPEFIPRHIFKIMVLDQAGGDETNKQSKDLWSYGVFGVEPCSNDEIGQNKVYVLDIEADKMSHSEGIDGVVRMYLRNGIIQKMGVEKTGLSTTEIHISNALKAYGRRISIDSGNLVLLKPGGRSKIFRIESALQWPLNNGKLFYSTAIPRRYVEAIQEEMNKFPFHHVDILDMWAYIYDMMRELNFYDEWGEWENEDLVYGTRPKYVQDTRDQYTGY